jgi:predicted dehydrogenase
MTIAALEAGASVLVEKPIAGTVAEADAMAAARDRAGKVVAVAYQYLYDPRVRVLKGCLLDGAVGSLRSLRFSGVWPRTNGYYRRNGWAGKLQHGGQWIYDSPANNAFAHFLMLMLFLAGDSLDACASVEEVEAELFRVNPIESFDTGCLRLKTDTGVAIHFVASHAGKTAMEPRVEIVGSHGRGEWSEGCVALDGRIEQRWVPKAGAPLRDEMLEAVCRRIRGERAFVCEIEMARCHTACIEAVHRTCGISTVDAAHVVEEGIWEGDRLRFIPDLAAPVRRAAEEERLFSEVGAPWATSTATS